jgi:hypothetical protein
MTPEFSHQLDRLKDLIAKSGPDRLFAAPLVTPEDTWFPDRWRPNLECVRRILLRLAEYAGLPDLDVEMVSEFEEAAETRVPDSVMRQRSTYGRKGMFLGIHEARAWFRVEESHLQFPQRLIGELVREMALAWRQVHDIHVTPHRTEEECADVTAVFLGFGILLCNSAFEPRLEGLRREIDWERSSYLYVYDVCELLACWAMLKELPEAEIVKHLGATQADLFGRAWTLWSEDDLRTRFGIPSDSMPEDRAPGGASQREFKPSLAATSVHRTVEQLVAAVGEEGGLAAEPIPFAVPVETLPHRRLAAWGRLSLAGTWTRMLALVSDAEWDTQAIVLVALPGSEFRRLALGHVRDRDANDPRQLQQLLTGAFRTGSPFRSYLAPGLPTFVSTEAEAGNFNLNHLEPMFRMLADDADPADVAREADWLNECQNVVRRLDFELEHGGIPNSPATGRGGSRRWWEVVSRYDHADDEQTIAAVYRRAARRHAAPPPTPASPPASSEPGHPES